MRTRSIALWTAIVAASTAPAHAERFTITLDPQQSEVTVTLTLAGQSDAEVSAVEGFVELSLDTVLSPASVRGRDFRLALTRDLAFSLSYGFFGNFNATLNDLVILYAAPGVIVGPVPVTAGSFTLSGVPARTTGVLNYTATGLVCTTLQSQNPPLPCVDTDDLSTEPVQNIELDSTLTSAGRVVSVVAQIDRTAPIDPANPGLGTVRVVGTVRGSVLVPHIPGDADQNCAVTFADVTSVLVNFGASGSGIPGDANNDGVVSFADVTSVLSNFTSLCE